MITVSIVSTDETVNIRLEHTIDYVVEKRFTERASANKRVLFVFFCLFISAAQLIFKELLLRSRL